VPPSDKTSRARTRQRLGVMVLAVVIIGLIVAITGVGAHIVAAKAGAGRAGAPAEVTFPDDVAAAASGAAPCTTVKVVSSLENADMISRLANAYSAKPRNIDGHCVTIKAVRTTSGDAAASAAGGFVRPGIDFQPAVWVPDSRTWLESAAASAPAVLPVDSARSIARSAEALAMPLLLAKVLGWQKHAPSWQEVFAVESTKNVWARRGHPEWGQFKLGKTSPLVATSGQSAMFASYAAAADHAGAPTAAEVADPTVIAKVTANELAVAHYMTTPEHFLWNAREAAQQQGSAAQFLSAIVVDEKSVWDYNRGVTSRDGLTITQSAPPLEPLVPIYPRDGAYEADNPAVVTTGTWMDPATTAAAKDFVRFATTRQGQRAVRASGYRDLNGSLDPDVQQAGLLAVREPRIIPMPAVDAITAVAKAFPAVRKRARVLFLVDLSGSMNDAIAEGRTKLSGAKDSILSALDYFTPGDRVGLAAFSLPGDGTLGPGMIVPPADIAGSRQQLNAAVTALTAAGGTPLYEAVDDFAKQQAQGWDPGTIDAIVLLTDGMNDTPKPTIDLGTVTGDLHGLRAAGTPVQVFTLAYGSDADVPVLQAIAAASDAQYFDTTDPTTLATVLNNLMTSF